MVVKKEESVNESTTLTKASIEEEVSSLDSLKRAAKNLEKSIGGLPIELATLTDVEKAILDCKDIPENLIRGLTLVVACNVFNNKSHPSHAPYRLLNALYTVNYEKTLEFFVDAVSKQLQSTGRRVACDIRMHLVRKWLLKSVAKCPNKLTLDLVAETLLTISELSTRLSEKSLSVKLFGLHKKLSLSKLIAFLDTKISDDPTNAWKVQCLAAVLLRALTSEQKRGAEASSTTADPDCYPLAKLWLKAFVSVYFTSKNYPGDDVFQFANGSNTFKHLLPADLDDSFRSALKKCFLRMPEVALPTLAIMFDSEHAFPTEITNLIIELIPDSFSSTSDWTHKQAAQVVARLLYLSKSEKRKNLLESVFGKQSKVKGRNEYILSFEDFMKKIRPDYVTSTDEHLRQFVADLFGFVEGELKAIKNDSAASTCARIFAALASQSHLFVADEALTKKYVDLAAVIFKLPVNSFGSCCTSAAVALATIELSSDIYPSSVCDTIKEHMTLFGNANTPPDFIFFSTLLLLKLAAKQHNAAKTDPLLQQVLASDFYTKEKFLNGLSPKAILYGSVFVQNFALALNGLNGQAIGKLPNLPTIVRFLLLLLEWPVKADAHPSLKVQEHLLVLKSHALSWLFAGFAKFVNSDEFGEMLIKQIDVINPHNSLDTSRLLIKSHFLSKVPAILRKFTSINVGASANELTDLVLNSIVLVSNVMQRDERISKELSTALLESNIYNQVVFESFFDSGVIDQIYSLQPLCCRQNVIGFLVGLESQNDRHRKFVWEKCRQICEQMNIEKLNHVNEKEASIFYTAEGTLYNTAVIDENSDFALDKQNLKRENKAYKFKDQVAEIELRKELAEKNKREGKLTPRQQEAIKKELVKEAKIRKELAPLYVAPKQLAELLPVVVRSDPNGALMNFEVFYSFVVPLLKSELVGKLMLECTRQYCDAFFSESSDFLGSRVLSALLRSAHSAFIVPEWSWEPFAEQLSKVFSSLQMLCMMNNLLDEQNAVDALKLLRDEEVNDNAFNEGLTLGKLAFIVPVLERVYTDVKVQERLRLEATNFLKAAFALDFLTMEEREWIPNKRINELLLEVMCDSNNIDYFNDVFELMRNILQKLNDENAASPNVGLYVKRLITQLRHPNEIIREHVAQLLMFCKDIIRCSCVDTDEIFYLSLVSIASKDVYRQMDNNLPVLIKELGLEVKPKMHDCIIAELEYPYEFWQKATALTLLPLFNNKTIAHLLTLYRDFQALLPAVTDLVGRVITPERDQWSSRQGIAIALEFYIDSSLYDVMLFEELIKFLVPDAINDKHDLVRQKMYKAATSLITKSGADRVEFVLPYLENLVLQLPDNADNDILRNGLVCLLGNLARYLEPNSPKLRTIFSRLMDAFLVPSRQVQKSVALCIPPLARLLKDDAMEKLRHLFYSISDLSSYAERCGYAYGVAGLTKGLGFKTLKEIRFLAMVVALFESKEAKCRESGCLLFMTMCFVHGRAFDPYIKILLQPLIKAFGDNDENVRMAAKDAGAQMMKSMSAQSVKVFLPEILSGLDSESWRTKCASAEFTASISNCAPTQLSECLPKVVPGLVTLMTDSHQKVKASGINALRQIATVITNPEILAISSHLISAFIEPAKETIRALQVIVNTKFIHYIDSPALALMFPIVKRALSDREPEGRRMASNVVTNIFSIADEKDIEPYIEMFVPNLKHSLLDPAPEVRSSAAQAIGAIVRHSLDNVFSSFAADLVTWLKEKMMNKNSMVDRLGAAQGLAEVISAFKGSTETILMQAIEFTSNANNDPAMRDGYIRLFCYLPSTMGDRFVAYIERVIPSILTALSSDVEYLRNSALHTGQILISTYCSQAKRYLLPSLLEGVINENWRIRHAAVTLIGDFLFNISGISSKMTSDTANDDDTMGMESVNKTIVRYVGQKTRDKILVSLYLARFDAGVQVRQAASHVWKLIVANTPRTVKELLPDLFDLIVYCISMSTEDRKIMAVECLSEVVHKQSERIIEQLMPELEKALVPDKDIVSRRGAIEALAVIINAVPSSEVFENYSKAIVRIFNMSLCDPDLRLRQSTGETFAVYYNKVGMAALEDIVDPLFNEYAASESDVVLDAIVAILSVNRRGRVLTVPSLVPRVLKFKSRIYVFSRLVNVIPDTIERNFIQIFTAAFDGQPPTLETEYAGQCSAVLQAIRSNYNVVEAYKFLALRAEEGSELALQIMPDLLKSNVRDETLAMLVENTMLLYTSTHKETQKTGSKLMSTLIQQCNNNQMLEIPTCLCTFVVGVREQSKQMLGLDAPGGWKPFIDLLALASRSASIDQREVTVHAIADLLQLTETANALRPVTSSVVAILLRLLADQCPVLLKLHSIQAINSLLKKVPESMRAFAPQLTNFMKRILIEAEEEFMGPDLTQLLEITERTLDEIKLLVP